MTAPEPLWQQIARTLTDEVRAASPGDRLPTEAQLAARFGVNRHTVRRALADLAGAGLVHARRGLGVQVIAPPTDYPISRRTRFHAALSATGRVPGRRVLSVQTAAADLAESEALALPPETRVIRAEGLTLSDGQVIGHFRSAFPVLAGLEQALAAGEGVTRALAACGIPDYTRAWTRLTAVAADGLLAGHLHLRRGEAMMRAVSLNIDPAGRPLEFGIAHFAGSRVTLTVEPE